jgi:hypothetical protein
MHKVAILAFTFLFSGCASTEKTDSSNISGDDKKEVPDKVALDKSQLHKILMGRYQVIAGSWYINKNCSFLPDEKSKNFEKYVGALNVYAQHNKLAPTEHLLQMQKNARFGASLEKYASCGQDAKTTVNNSFKLAEMLHQDLVQL